mmetsp:Transcript_46874/g.118614  ORF Transcript_46874/g.118614 Transcript_46874/m.118614 type:complete len:160 (-) Transcript_46874:262-741(-)
MLYKHLYRCRLFRPVCATSRRVTRCPSSWHDFASPESNMDKAADITESQSPVLQQGSPGLLAVSASKDSTLRVWDATAGVCLATQPYSGGQCSAMDLLGRDAGGRPDTGSEATWRVPGHKGTFARLLCTADMQGSTALWGLRSLDATGSGAQLQQLASS